MAQTLSRYGYKNRTRLFIVSSKYRPPNQGTHTISSKHRISNQGFCQKPLPITICKITFTPQTKNSTGLWHKPCHVTDINKSARTLLLPFSRETFTISVTYLLFNETHYHPRKKRISQQRSY